MYLSETYGLNSNGQDLKWKPNDNQIKLIRNRSSANL